MASSRTQRIDGLIAHAVRLRVHRHTHTHTSAHNKDIVALKTKHKKKTIKPATTTNLLDFLSRTTTHA